MVGGRSRVGSEIIRQPKNQGYGRGRVYRIREPQRSPYSTLEEPHAYACVNDEIPRRESSGVKSPILVLEALGERKTSQLTNSHGRFIGAATATMQELRDNSAMLILEGW